MKINMHSGFYDVLNSSVRYILPAFGTLYFALADIWGLPYATEVLGTVAALATFLGVVIALARSGWTPPNDGALVVDESDPNKDILRLEVSKTLDELRNSEGIHLKVLRHGDETPQQ